jgi:RNA polymerase sigma-54 factor
MLSSIAISRSSRRRDLFVAPASGAETRARTSVRDLVRTVVGEEDEAKPLSDDEIVAALARRGVGVARRTVAKYRSELGIPSSYRRKRHG